MVPVVKRPVFASSGRFISIPLMERGKSASHRKRRTDGQLECHWCLCAVLMGRRFGSVFVTLLFMNWPPLFSGLPPLGIGPHTSSVGICKKCETFSHGLWNYCCCGSRYCPLPSVDWECNCCSLREWNQGCLHFGQMFSLCLPLQYSHWLRYILSN